MTPLEDDFDLETELKRTDAGIRRAIDALNEVIRDCEGAETVNALEVLRAMKNVRGELYDQAARLLGVMGELSDDS